MEIIAILWAVAVFFIVIGVLSNWGERIDILTKRKKFVNGRSKKQDNFEELENSFSDRFFKPVIVQVQAFIAKMNSSERKNGKKNDSTKQIEQQLRMAGINLSVEVFTFYKYAFMFATVIISLFLAAIASAQRASSTVVLLIIAGGLMVAILAPSLILGTLARSRQSAIRNQLPDALDLLGVCIEAGLSFDNSLLKVAEKLEGPFIEELMNVYREIQMGVPRNDALKKLSDGSEIPELKTFISALIQANQLGIPINNVMTVQSAQLRETRKQLAKEKGAKAPVMMLIPMLLFIFPVLFIMLMAPTVLNIMEMF